MLVGVAAVVVLVLVAGIALALTRGGDDGQAGDGSTTTGPADTTAGPGGGPTTPAGTISTPLGAPLAVPTGLATEPGAPSWSFDMDCSTSGACSVVADDGGVVVVTAPGEGGATVTRYDADGTKDWSLPVTDIESPPGLARLGGLVIVASTSGDTRTYRAIADGEEMWSIDLAQDDGPVFPNTQLSETYGVLLLGKADAYVVIDLENGANERFEGRVLATDRAHVYLADGDRVVARALSDGAEAWEAEDVVSAAPEGVFPAWRYGVTTSGTFVTVTADSVVGLRPEDGAPVWEPVPLSADQEDLGRPIAVADVGGTVVVAAEYGDLGIDAATGEVVWREVRDRLVFDPQLDADTIDAVNGSPVWVGTGDRLLVGWTGAHLQLIDVTNGARLGAVDLEPNEGRSAVAIAGDGIAILRVDGTIAGYGYDSLDGELWSTDAYPEATGLAAVDGGLVVVDPSGVHGLVPR